MQRQRQEMIELIVSDIQCGQCVQAIERVIESVDRAGKAQVDSRGWAAIETSEPAGRFVAALGEAGFAAQVWWDGRRAPV